MLKPGLTRSSSGQPPDHAKNHCHEEGPSALEPPILHDARDTSSSAFIQAEPRLDEPPLREAEQDGGLEEAQNSSDEEEPPNSGDNLRRHLFANAWMSSDAKASCERVQ